MLASRPSRVGGAGRSPWPSSCLQGQQRQLGPGAGRPWAPEVFLQAPRRQGTPRAAAEAQRPDVIRKGCWQLRGWGGGACAWGAFTPGPEGGFPSSGCCHSCHDPLCPQEEGQSLASRAHYLLTVGFWEKQQERKRAEGCLRGWGRMLSLPGGPGGHPMQEGGRSLQPGGLEVAPAVSKPHLGLQDFLGPCPTDFQETLPPVTHPSLGPCPPCLTPKLSPRPRPQGESALCTAALTEPKDPLSPPTPSVL